MSVSRRWRDQAYCPWGDACLFAHGPEQLRVFEDWDDEQWQQPEDKVGFSAISSKDAYTT